MLIRRSMVAVSMAVADSTGTARTSMATPRGHAVVNALSSVSMGVQQRPPS